MTNLSLRLKTIASLVPHGARVCDVGTDHAHLPIFLKQSGIAETVIATDLNPKPLENAKRNIEISGEKNISLRLCDGLSGVSQNEVDTVIVAGMGGEVIAGILNGCQWAKSKDKLFILQPTTSAEVLREFLVKNGFEIVSETPIFENRKLYSVMVAKFADKYSCYPEYFFYIGKIPTTPDGILYIKKQQKRVYECMKALENIESKQTEFEKNKSVYYALTKILTENDNGI